MSERKDIWQDGKLPDDKLLAYLEGKLSPEEQREVEARLAEEGMESDALEGLKTLPAPEIQQLSSRINYKLQYELRNKKYRSRRLFKDGKWGWLAVIIILMICVLGYMVIRWS